MSDIVISTAHGADRAPADPLPECLNVTTHVDSRFGGLTTSIPPFCEAVRATGRYSARVAAFCDPDEGSQGTDGDAPLILPFGRLRWLTDSALKRTLAGEVERAAVVQIHGIWQEHCSVAAHAARRSGTPYVVAAHGMLEPWALANKKWKKRLYWGAVEKSNLSGARCLRALTLAEAEQYRSAGLKQPVAVIPNGVTVPASVSPAAFLDQFPDLKDRRLILFLGRLNAKKGIHLLCQAWASISAEYPGAHLVLAGPDSDGTQASLEALVSQLGVAGRVTFTGMLRGDLRWSALRAASVFVLPSYSEGFSVAILEALGVGVPVLISRQCYFPEVREAGAGWVVEPEQPAVVKALRESIEASTSELENIGRQGQQLVEKRFRWPIIGSQSSDLFDWVLGGPRPTSLEVLW